MTGATLSESDVGRATDFLLEATAGGRLIDALPLDCTPGTIDEAYAIQAKVFAARESGAAKGWYVGAANPDMQRQLGLNEAFSARWRTDRFLPSGAVVAQHGNLPTALEAEVTLRLGQDLPPREREYQPEEVARAVESMHASIEVVITCFSDWLNQLPLSLIAEGGPEQYLVVGPPVTDWQALDLESMPVAMTVNDSTVAEGNVTNVTGGPLGVLVWLANHASRRGIGLGRGQFVNTGTCAPPYWVEPGDQARACFERLGDVELTIS
jgi:2-keto-4-pentenoate hydratase